MTKGDATVRVEARFKNARLYNAIVGHAVCLHTDPRLAALVSAHPIRSWCHFVGIQATTVYDLLNLKAGPLRKDGTLRPVCVAIAGHLGLDVQWLFPDEVYRIKWPRVVAKDVSHEHFVPRFVPLARAAGLLVSATQDQDLNVRQLGEQVAHQLHTLTPREEHVVKLLFGVAGHEEHTLGEVASIYNVSAERIRQVKAKALRKLRHPRRARSLAPFLQGHGGE